MPRSLPLTKPIIFVGIGEVLFDVFEDGTETLGGAPLNFAIHAHQLAGRTGVGKGIIVSCINPDRMGNRIINSLRGRRMSTRYVGKDPGHPTGLVSVFMRNGEPCYQIEAGAAWDYITDTPALRDLAGQCSAVCFGSLAQRCGVSRSTIRSFLKNAPPKAIRLYDVNLRQNTLTGEAGYSPEIVDYSCQAATIIKANQSELFAILDLLGINCPVDRALDGIRRGMEALLTRFPARVIVVTRGGEGTLVLNHNGEFHLTAPIPIEGKPYPVGAGDACSAGILFGMALGWNIHSTMELANRMGANAVAHPSATPPLSNATLNFARAQLHNNEAGKADLPATRGDTD
jgi:fructokinase